MQNLPNSINKDNNPATNGQQMAFLVHFANQNTHDGIGLLITSAARISGIRRTRTICSYTCLPFIKSFSLLHGWCGNNGSCGKEYGKEALEIHFCGCERRWSEDREMLIGNLYGSGADGRQDLYRKGGDVTGRHRPCHRDGRYTEDLTPTKK